VVKREREKEKRTRIKKEKDVGLRRCCTNNPEICP
jgi:hypothetical protein